MFLRFGPEADLFVMDRDVETIRDHITNRDECRNVAIYDHDLHVDHKLEIVKGYQYRGHSRRNLTATDAFDRLTYCLPHCTL